MAGVHHITPVIPAPAVIAAFAAIHVTGKSGNYLP